MTQRILQDLRGDPVQARDGTIGEVDDAFFDDERWTVRYLVVDTGSWLPGRKVLISPRQVPSQPPGDYLRVNLTREQVEQAPGIEQDAPVSRQLEDAHARYYRYPAYWAGPYLWGFTNVPYASPSWNDAPPGDSSREKLRAAEQRARESHLRSTREVAGYRIRALDGELGHVEDFEVDDETWAIRGMVVDTRNWLPGRKVVVPPEAVTAVDWDNRAVSVRMTREEIERAPEV